MFLADFEIMLSSFEKLYQ